MKLEITKDSQVVETRELESGTYSIGRSSQSLIQLKSEQVSKTHATLVVRGTKAAIADAGSSNGIFVNGILVQKVRLNAGDDIAIGPYRLRIVLDNDQRQSGMAFDGNAARQLDFSALPEDVPQTTLPEEKPATFIDDKILGPFYLLMKLFSWRLIAGSIIASAVTLSVLFSSWPFLNWGERILVGETISRGQAILRQIVRENYRVLSKTTDYTRLSVEASEREPGVLTSYIADPVNRNLIAPAKYFNKPVNDAYVLRAIEKLYKEEVEDEASVEKSDGSFVLAQPIFQYSGETKRKMVGVAILEIEVANNLYSIFTPFSEMALLCFFIGLLTYFLIVKMMSRPLGRMLEQVDAALKGEAITISSEANLPELHDLAQNINFAISRMKQGDGAAPVPESSGSSDGDGMLISVIQAIESGCSDGILVLDVDKKICFVGRVIEELLGLRAQYGGGQNIGDACRDQAFAGTAIDLCDRVVQSLGEMQTAALEINGTSRNLTASAIRNQANEIRFVCLTVKMNG